MNSEGKQPSKLTLHFKPVGNLLRIQFNNLLPEAKTLQSFKIKSNAFVTQAKFDFSNGNNLQLDINNYTGENPTTQSGSPMAFLPENYQTEKTYQLDTPIRIEANSKSRWYYLWVMPLAYNTRDVNNGLVSFLTQATGIGHDSKEYNLSAVCSPLSEGSNKLSMSLNIRPASTLATAFKGGKLPLWYVAEYDVAPNGSTFANTHMLTERQEDQSSTFGFFRTSEFSSVNVPGYYIPDTWDYSAIVPRVQTYDGTVRPDDKYITTNTRTYEYGRHQPIVKIIEEIRFPGEPSPISVSSTYHFTNHNATNSIVNATIYALRFEGCGNRDRLTAYRYQLSGTIVNADEYYWITTSARMIVTSKFLGSGFKGDINTISTPSFWSTYDNGADQIIRVFPLAESFPRLEDFYAGDRYRIFVGHGLIDGVGIIKITPSIGVSTNNDFHYQGYPKEEIGEISYPLRLFKNEYKTVR